jgi:hypothetical protein
MLIVAGMLILATGLGLLGLGWLAARDLPDSNDDFIFI